MPGHTSSRSAIVASIAAVGSVLAATTCCLPVLPFVMAAGFAGGSAFLSAARPYLLAASILLIGFGFLQARRMKQCHRRPNVVSSVLLWTSALVVALSILIPQVIAARAWLAGPTHAPPGQPPFQEITAQMSGIRDAFNAASRGVRVLLLLSPT
jgi:hypothetical protein